MRHSLVLALACLTPVACARYVEPAVVDDQLRVDGPRHLDQSPVDGPRHLDQLPVDGPRHLDQLPEDGPHHLDQLPVDGPRHLDLMPDNLAGEGLKPDTVDMQIDQSIPSGCVWLGTDSARWSEARNWAGGRIPDASCLAVFDNRCTHCDVDIDAKITVLGVEMRTAFGGTITPSDTATIRVGTSGWTQRAGRFLGGAAAVTLENGSFELSGGMFRAPHSRLEIQPRRASVTVLSISSAGSFDHNGGTVGIRFAYAGNNYSIFEVDMPAGQVLNHLDLRAAFSNYWSGTVSLTRSVVLDGGLWVGSTALQGASVTVKGVLDLGLQSRDRVSVASDLIMAGPGTPIQRIVPGRNRLTTGSLSIAGGAAVELTGILDLSGAGQQLRIDPGTLYQRGHDVAVGGALQLGPSSEIVRAGGTLTVQGIPIADGLYDQGTISP